MPAWIGGLRAQETLRLRARYGCQALFRCPSRAPSPRPVPYGPTTAGSMAAYMCGVAMTACVSSATSPGSQETHRSKDPDALQALREARCSRLPLVANAPASGQHRVDRTTDVQVTPRSWTPCGHRVEKSEIFTISQAAGPRCRAVLRALLRVCWSAPCVQRCWCNDRRRHRNISKHMDAEAT